ncbi:hypothetical protein [Streptomyces sp. NBC_00582]|uniref:hypothetical protein n=1 Tax=Streptomyces sp. NBC_00582 TaxID=2975783 RepID=UPI002E804E1E|nr:hypothetical protein [Streptomyces sp. NBC_00582]WUB66760.1 hypothetical protein OG852_43340 [Streptomyces sp. NBC_00582]
MRRAGEFGPAAVMLAAMAAVRLGPRPEDEEPLWAALALAAVIAGSLAVRRSRPLTARAVGTAGLAVEALTVGPGPLTPVANLIGVYSVGLCATPPRARLGALLVLPGVPAYFAPEDRPASVPVETRCGVPYAPSTATSNCCGCPSGCWCGPSCGSCGTWPTAGGPGPRPASSSSAR